RSLWTAPLGIAQLTECDTPVTLLLAGSVVVTLPVVGLLIFARRLLISALPPGGEKRLSDERAPPCRQSCPDRCLVHRGTQPGDRGHRLLARAAVDRGDPR